MTNKMVAAVLSTAAKQRTLVMKTYLHAAALLLVGAALMPALADSSSAQTPSGIALSHMTPFQVCKAKHTMDPNGGANCSPDGSYNPIW
jgi:hypothetical protein